MASRDDVEPSLARFERRSLWVRRIRTWLPSGLILLVAVIFLLDVRGADGSGSTPSPPGADSAGGWPVLATILLMVLPVAAFTLYLLAYGAGLPPALRRAERQESHDLADSVWAEVASAHRRGDAGR